MEGVTLVNYGLGNIQAFVHIYKRLNIPVHVATTVKELNKANRLILPGVGAFDWAMSRLNNSGLRSALDKLVLIDQIPVLGICVGMQMMASNSDEGDMDGLGWINASVLRFDQDRLKLPALPHMGWNDVDPSNKTTLFEDIVNPRFYFLHSYYFFPENSEHSLATAEYGEDFTAAICMGHIYGTQFHPEKSHSCGIALLNNFAHL